MHGWVMKLLRSDEVRLFLRSIALVICAALVAFVWIAFEKFY